MNIFFFFRIVQQKLENYQCYQKTLFRNDKKKKNKNHFSQQKAETLIFNVNHRENILRIFRCRVSRPISVVLFFFSAIVLCK